ncbi:rhodanese-like domain-containing protein [Cesiribacter sp. SM1]|uniref:rhodanese-like domain-containing protein n=1 Tax=Cesiribacter sp. SM1 TaxID=2861196 RepID=UPI001CD3E5D9|nr:rhodanese-like domain-containing protein [Cesiribacter sp. SM1]
MADITAEELKERMDNGEKPYILDVREEAEYQTEGNINGQLIPLGTLPHRLNELKAGKDDEIIVHCRSGKRSATAQKFLKQQGYTNVRNLEGGILAWGALD